MNKNRENLSFRRRIFSKTILNSLNLNYNLIRVIEKEFYISKSINNIIRRKDSLTYTLKIN